jgi:hypothetical protein
VAGGVLGAAYDHGIAYVVTLVVAANIVALLGVAMTMRKLAR